MVECGAQFGFDLLLRSGAGKFLHGGRRLFEQLHIFNSTNYVIARVCTESGVNKSLQKSFIAKFACFLSWRANCTYTQRYCDSAE